MAIREDEVSTIIEEPKRRGRPPKRKVEAAPETASTASEEGTPENAVEHVVETIQEPPKVRRGRRPNAPKATPGEVAQAAPLLVALTNQVAVAWAGPECSMLPQEAAILTPSIARMLARLPRGAADAVSAYTDPFVVLVALGLWARRIQTIKIAQSKAAFVRGPLEDARANGYSGFAYDVPDTLTDETPVVPFREDVNEKPVDASRMVNTIMATASPV